MSLPLFAAVLGLLFHVGSKEVRRFEQLAASDLSSRLEGLQNKVSVQVQLGSLRPGHLKEVRILASGFRTPSLPLWTEPWRSQEGRIDRLVIRLTDFEIGDLPVRSLDIVLNDCRWDVACAVREGKIRLSRSGTGTFEAAVTEQGVRLYIVKRYPFVEVKTFKIDRYKVIFEGDLLTPLGRTNFALVAVGKPWKTTGLSLEPAYLSFANKRISLDRNPAMNQLLNPVVDLDRDFGLRGALTIGNLKQRNQELLLSGTAFIPAAD